jgi:hypothetical protein
MLVHVDPDPQPKDFVYKMKMSEIVIFHFLRIFLFSSKYYLNFIKFKEKKKNSF